MFTLPPLPYDYSALEPYIDAETMRIHHDKHHQTYVDNLNKALENHPELAKLHGTDLLNNLDKVPQDLRTKVKNNLGGVLNHNLFWQIMTGAESGKRLADSLTMEQWNNLTIGKKIVTQFESLDKFQEQFSAAALSIFGSGWCWLVENGRKLEIITTPNQDNPLMPPSGSPQLTQLTSPTQLTIVLGLDVWEHAYYLKYQNRRADYIKAWWNVVNWQKVEERLKSS